MRKEGCISTGPSRALATVMYLVWIRLFLNGTYLALPLIVQPACILYSHKRQDNLPHLSPRQRMNFRVSTTYSIPLSICISTFHHHDFERYVIYVAQYDYVILIQTVLMLTLIPTFPVVGALGLQSTPSTAPPNPYVKVNVGDFSARTPTLHGRINPTWSKIFDLCVPYYKWEIVAGGSLCKVRRQGGAAGDNYRHTGS